MLKMGNHKDHASSRHRGRRSKGESQGTGLVKDHYIAPPTPMSPCFGKEQATGPAALGRNKDDLGCNLPGVRNHDPLVHPNGPSAWPRAGAQCVSLSVHHWKM